MRYGLTSDDIIVAFSGAISGDFASWTSSGTEVIENEIDLQSARLDTILPQFVVATFQEVEGEILTPTSAGVVTPGLPVDTIGYFRIYNPAACYDNNNCSIDSSLTYTDNGDGTYTLTTTEKVIAKYTVDQATVEDESLKALLRDMTCCSLGRKLFPSGTETWDIVQYYCDGAKEVLDVIKNNKSWKPSSMATMKFHKPIFASIRMLRG